MPPEPEPGAVRLVVNPSAGRGRAGTLLPLVVNELVAGLPGRRIEVNRATDFGDAHRLIDRAASLSAEDDGIAAVMGGDGMLHLGVNACAGTSVPLGLIPAGTGNDMCRGFGVPYANPIHAAKVLVAGHTRTVDLMRVDRRDGDAIHVGTVVATGFDALVNQRANAMTWPKNNLRYSIAALAELATFDPIDYHVVIDGEPQRLPAMLIAIANGAFFGGGMKIAPDADVTDGLSDLTIIHPVSRAVLLRLLPTMFSGGFVKHPCVERRRVRTIEVLSARGIAMGDGEPLGGLPIGVLSRPGALTVFSERA